MRRQVFPSSLAKNSERKRVTSIADALRDVEGVDVGGSVGKTGGRNISMRGMPSDYTLILIDGRRQNTAGSVTPNGFGENLDQLLSASGQHRAYRSHSRGRCRRFTVPTPWAV